MKEILIIGGSSFMGYTLRERLLARRDEFAVTCLNRNKTYWNDKQEAENGFTHWICDRHDTDKFMSLLNSRPVRERPVTILKMCNVSLFAQPFHVVVDFIAFEPSDMQPLFDYLTATKAHYVFISTDSIYEACEPDKSLRRGEDADERPSDPAERARLRKLDKYGDNKLRCEEALASSAVHFTSLRLCDVFGPRDNDNNRHWCYQLIVRLFCSLMIIS